MPNKNNMGPLGEGPMTGRGLGNCKGADKSDNENTFGRGRCRGQGGRGKMRGQGRGRANENGNSFMQTISDRLNALENIIFKKG